MCVHDFDFAYPLDHRGHGGTACRRQLSKRYWVNKSDISSLAKDLTSMLILVLLSFLHSWCLCNIGGGNLQVVLSHNSLQPICMVTNVAICPV